MLCAQNLFETLKVSQKLALKLSVPLLAVKKLRDLLTNGEKKSLKISNAFMSGLY